MKDHYFILGISRDASAPEIKEAFRKLCLKYHPDKTVHTPHNQARYIEICEAYKILSNPAKRQRYDRKLSGAPAGQGTGLSGLKGSIFPEIQTSYKGHYPWFAAFAVIIVGSLALLFVGGRGASPGRISGVRHLPVIDTDRSKTIKAEIDTGNYQRNTFQVNVDSTGKKPEVVTASGPSNQDTASLSADSIKQTEQKIVSALKKHTPWRISKVLATTGGNTAPYEEWDHKYALRNGKLYVSFKSDKYGIISNDRVVIPVKDVQTVYYSNEKIWISSKRRSIQVYNSLDDAKVNTEFFAIKVEGGDPRKLESELATAFSDLKKRY